MLLAKDAKGRQQRFDVGRDGAAVGKVFQEPLSLYTDDQRTTSTKHSYPRIVLPT